MKKIVVLTGAGMSAESGIRTFRDMGGLWEEYDISEVATPEAWAKNPALVMEFYNQHRKQLLECQPNQGHLNLVKLEEKYQVQVITQNVDDLHERAGSSNVLHLHGELKKTRSTLDPSLVYEINGWELKLGDLCEKGSQLRPHIVWFGEPVDAIGEAIEWVQEADVLVVIGTSLNVYPAAGLLNYTRSGIPVYLIDPADLPYSPSLSVTHIRQKAVEGTLTLLNNYLK